MHHGAELQVTHTRAQGRTRRVVEQLCPEGGSAPAEQPRSIGPAGSLCDWRKRKKAGRAALPFLPAGTFLSLQSLRRSPAAPRTTPVRLQPEHRPSRRPGKAAAPRLRPLWPPALIVSGCEVPGAGVGCAGTGAIQAWQRGVLRGRALQCWQVSQSSQKRTRPEYARCCSR